MRIASSSLSAKCQLTVVVNSVLTNFSSLLLTDKCHMTSVTDGADDVYN